MSSALFVDVVSYVKYYSIDTTRLYRTYIVPKYFKKELNQNFRGDLRPVKEKNLSINWGMGVGEGIVRKCTDLW